MKVGTRVILRDKILAFGNNLGPDKMWIEKGTELEINSVDDCDGEFVRLCWPCGDIAAYNIHVSKIEPKLKTKTIGYKELPDCDGQGRPQPQPGTRRWPPTKGETKTHIDQSQHFECVKPDSWVGVVEAEEQAVTNIKLGEYLDQVDEEADCKSEDREHWLLISGPGPDFKRIATIDSKGVFHVNVDYGDDAARHFIDSVNATLRRDQELARISSNLDKLRDSIQDRIAKRQWLRSESEELFRKGKIIAKWMSDTGKGVHEIAKVIGTNPNYLLDLVAIFKQFGVSRRTYPNLEWSHFHAAKDWPDCRTWLRLADINRWSVLMMKKEKFEALLEQTKIPKSLATGEPVDATT